MAIRVVMQQPALAKYRIPVFKELAARPGIDLHVHHAAIRNLPNVPPDGFSVSQYYIKYLGTFEWHALPRRFLNHDRTDVLILTWNVRHVSLIPMLLAAYLRGIPVVVWGQGASKNESPLRRWVRWSITRLATAVVVYSHSVADELTRGGFDRSRIFVAQNTLDQTEIQAAREHWLACPDDLAKFRADNNLGRGPHLLFVSRLTEGNQVEVLIKALPTLLKTQPDARVTIIGNGPLEQSLKDLVTSMKLESRVHFTGAIYKDLELAPWFLCADLFVYPSNIGLSIIHALGFGLPIVLGNNRRLHNPEIDAFREGHTGASFRHGDPEALAKLIDELMRDPARMARMREAAYTTATQEFTLARMVAGLEAAIRFATAAPVLQAIDRAHPDEPVQI